MLKSIHKKKLSLLFAVVALTIPCILCPMKKRRTKNVIKNLPDDCLCEVFQFYADENIKNSSALRLVCKDFKKVIDEKPCYFTRINEQSYFLRYRFEHIDFPYAFRSSIARLHDEEIVGKFVNEPFLSDLNNRLCFVYMKLHEKEYSNFLIPHLKHLISRLKENKNKLEILNVQFHDAPGYVQSFGIDVLKAQESKKKLQANKLLFSKKKVVFNEELNMFRTVQNLEIKNCNNFASTEIEWPEGVQSLCLKRCEKFDLGRFKNLVDLKKLKLDKLNELEGNKLNDAGLKSLESLTVLHCKKFNPTGLENLEKLHELEVDENGQLDGCLSKALKNIHKLKLAKKISYWENGDEEIEKKMYKLLQTARELENLRELTIFCSLHFSQRPEIIEELKKIKENGCIIKLDGTLDGFY